VAASIGRLHSGFCCLKISSIDRPVLTQGCLFPVSLLTCQAGNFASECSRSKGCSNLRRGHHKSAFKLRRFQVRAGQVEGSSATQTSIADLDVEALKALREAAVSGVHLHIWRKWSKWAQA
jgi:hypothetical protein